VAVFRVAMQTRRGLAVGGKDPGRRDKGKVLMWQTLCNDSPLVLDFDAHAFVVSHDLSSLTYEGETYTYYEHPPQLCAQGQWCPVDAPQGYTRVLWPCPGHHPAPVYTGQTAFSRGAW
jgi:hypothetical protein